MKPKSSVLVFIYSAGITLLIAGITIAAVHALSDSSASQRAGTPSSVLPQPVHAQISLPQPSSAAPRSVPPPLPRTAPLPPEADPQGFVGYPGARCNYTNPAIVIARTADSLIVICQTGVGRLYYKGFGLENRLSVEIADPVRSGATYVATNDGFQYSASPDGLVITQGPTVLSKEPMLTYWTE